MRPSNIEIEIVTNLCAGFDIVITLGIILAPVASPLPIKTTIDLILFEYINCI